MRASIGDEAIRLIPPKIHSLEQAIDFITAAQPSDAQARAGREHAAAQRVL